MRTRTAGLVLAATLALSIVTLVAAPAAGAREADDGRAPTMISSLRARAAALLEAAEAARREAAEAAADAAAAAARAAAEPTPVPCDRLTGGHIPTLVFDIFTCRLLEAGAAEADARYLAAEAVVVARCESLFDPAAVVFDGAYLEQRHPYTGMFYSAAGVFQFIRTTADTWIVGGYGNAHDPVANIDAAARLVVHNLANGFGGWEDWACAAANDGFKVGSVLPGWPGGPAELPDWAWQR